VPGGARARSVGRAACAHAATLLVATLLTLQAHAAEDDWTSGDKRRTFSAA